MRKSAQQPTIDDAALQKAAECLRTMAHPDRLKMIDLLLKGRYTVGELAEYCDIASPVASGHLRLMQHCGLLRQERDGRNVYYGVAQPCLREFLSCIRRHFDEKAQDDR